MNYDFVSDYCYANSKVSRKSRDEKISGIRKTDSLWLSGGASERGIRMSKVQFLMGLRIFSLSRARGKTGNIFFYFLPSLILTIFLILFTKHDALDLYIADPSSMPDECHM